MKTVEQLAAIVASGLVNSSLYKKCTRISDFNLNQPAEYALDVEAVVRDALDIAIRIQHGARQ